MSAKNIELSPIRLSDARFLSELCSYPNVRKALAISEHDTEHWRTAIKDWLRDPEEEEFIVWTRHPKRKIGWIGINGLCNKNNTAWIKMMALHPDFWGKGLCRSIMQVAKDRLADNGYKKVKMWTDAANSRAIRCYEATGFTRVKE